MPLQNSPKILRGAFVEYGISLPPLWVVFQFNPVELTRSRSLSFNAPGASTMAPAAAPPAAPGGVGTASAAPAAPAAVVPRPQSLRDWHKGKSDLDEIRQRQEVTIGEETLSFDIRLDATDKMEDGDVITAGFGVLPQLSTLELMVRPKGEGLLNAALGALLGGAPGYSFTQKDNPPLVLFIWGLKRVLPVNITSMNVKETEFSTLLDPVRATVTVSLSVIEGKNPLYTYSKVLTEAASLLNLANIADMANILVPG
jgi:hypothetical protein